MRRAWSRMVAWARGRREAEVRVEQHDHGVGPVPPLGADKNALYGIAGGSSMEPLGRLVAATAASCMPCQRRLLQELAQDRVHALHMLGMGFLAVTRLCESIQGGPSTDGALFRAALRVRFGKSLVEVWMLFWAEALPEAWRLVARMPERRLAEALEEVLDLVLGSAVVETWLAQDGDGQFR